MYTHIHIHTHMHKSVIMNAQMASLQIDIQRQFLHSRGPFLSVLHSRVPQWAGMIDKRHLLDR